MSDLDTARNFMATHARMLDRRRFDVVFDGGPRDEALAALDAYRNDDGGYGWGLEPDLRDTSSQPAPALHAFEVFEAIAPATSPRAAELCDWLATATLPDGGLPFALPVRDPTGCAPFWANADPEKSSLQITAIVATNAHRVGAHDATLKDHPWLAQATEYCLSAIDAIGDEQPHALVLSFAIRLLDDLGDEARLERLGRHIPENGLVHVGGGLEDEYMRPLDFAPFPDRPARRLFTQDAIDAELDRLAAKQEDDGGFTVDYASYSPAAELEWRGYITVRSLQILRANGR